MTNELPIEGRAKAALWLSWAVAGLSAVAGLFELLEAQGMVDLEAIDLSPLAATAGLVYVGLALAYVASIVAVCMWIHRAHARLQGSGMEGLEFTPGWAVGWYFIPFANLVKPFQAMRELWNGSNHGEEYLGHTAPSLLSVWWGTWIVGNIVSNISFRMSTNGGPDTVIMGLYLGAVGSVLTAICAVALTKIIRKITAAQSTGPMNAQVFA